MGGKLHVYSKSGGPFPCWLLRPVAQFGQDTVPCKTVITGSEEECTARQGKRLYSEQNVCQLDYIHRNPSPPKTSGD